MRYLIIIALALAAGVNFPEAYKEARGYMQASPLAKTDYLIEKMK